MAITPLFDGLNIQSTKLVFPIGIYEGDESTEEMRNAFGSIIEELKDKTITRGDGSIHKLTFVTVADLKSGWSLYNLKRGECMFCKCSTVGDRTVAPSSYKIFTRTYKDEDFLFKELGISSFCICSIHMRMRIVDQFLFILAGQVKNTKYESKLRNVMKELGLKFEYLPVKNAKGKKTQGWKLPGYSGIFHFKLIL